MTCIICNGPTVHYLSKTFTEEPLHQIMHEVGQVDYHKCVDCGFSFSKTHFDLEDSIWVKLNHDFHSLIADGKLHDAHGNYPPYLDQAVMVHLLATHGLVRSESVLDYAGGTGTFSDILLAYFGIPSSIFDPYMHREEDKRFVTRRDLDRYDIVFNSAMFEHVRTRHDLDEVDRAVAKNGVLMIHSVICENIPADPDWFYYRPPVHCAFHTNISMNILMNQWGYSCSIYSPKAKCWVLFKEKPLDFEKRIMALNDQLKNRFFYFSNQFVDFWKGFYP